ncbi:MAG TPA: hydroxyacid dehydrogenase [Firmicutes bacterium]|nr:hydroxyacid dehydrogenase [Bacillota bacterium]
MLKEGIGVEGVERVKFFAALPPEGDSSGLRAEIRSLVVRSGAKVVALDDDPTGVQTVHGVRVYTVWDDATAEELVREEEPLAFILTNSRSLAASAARAVNEAVGTAVLQAARRRGRPVVFLSRSDSTLRGHYPLEVLTLAGLWEAAYDRRLAGHLLVPAFPEGERYTVGDIHYVGEGERVFPAGETEFARDPAFGYKSSDLKAWVEEKSGGFWRREDVFSVPLTAVRGGGPDKVAEYLDGVRRGQPVVVNAVSYADLDIIVRGLLAVEEGGKHFLYRTAAAFAKVRGGITDRALLGAADLFLPGAEGSGGLVVVGSHVERTNRQLAVLRAAGYPVHELRAARLLLPEERAAELARVAALLEQELGYGRVAVVATSRTVLGGAGAEEGLALSRSISRALAALVGRIKVTPRFIVAKGGITSSDIATQGLGVRKALVLGQIRPGVPVWRLGEEARFPGLPYVVFPGNVGTDRTLLEVVETLAAPGPQPGAGA